MMKTLLLFLCLILLTTNFGLGGTLHFEEKEDNFSTTTVQEYLKLKGLLLIGWSLYAGYLGYRMLTDKGIRRGDVELVGTLFLVSSSVLFLWGISLVF